MSTPAANKPKLARRDLIVAVCVRRPGRGRWSALSFAAVPFYNWFCRATGFGGTTQVATARRRRRCSTARSPCASTPMSRPACRGGSSPSAEPIEVKLGEVVTVHYKVTNEAARATAGAGRSTMSAPPTVGAYFDKINCFCFTEQT